jgi:hypothetical protein
MATELTYFAKQDLDKARREHYLLVAGTKEGLVAVRYQDGVYTVTSQGPNSAELFRGARKAALSYMTTIYTVEVVA